MVKNLNQKYIYYDPRPDNLKGQGLCFARATSKFLNRDFLEVLNSFKEVAEEMGENINSASSIAVLLKRLSFKRVWVEGAQAIEELINLMGIKNALVDTGDHMVCIKDGVLYDNFNSLNCSVYCYWVEK